MPTEDLLELAKSETDFYALLGEEEANLHAGSTDKEISRAYRRAALKHHPDKNKDDPNAVTKFHALQIAYDVLSDPAARTLHDQVRAAREARKLQTSKLDGRRKQLVEDLLRREGVKRKRDDEGDAMERELKRLAEDGRRRRMELDEKRRREADEEIREEQARAQDRAQEAEKVASTPRGGSSVPEISRTVKIRWKRHGPGLDMDKEKLQHLFGRFGTVDSAAILKDRKMRLVEGEKKQLIGTGIVVFKSIVGAHAAVADWKKLGPDWEDIFESAEWAGKEPDLSTAQVDSPSTPSSQKFSKSSPFTTPAQVSKQEPGLRKVPSFASFQSGRSPSSPSLEEVTLIRLKNAEKKRLEDKIRREEALRTNDTV
ncbi:DnaJ-domain-containing protein [Microthyrium microscopicum]|uniref:DnaJ-domain-containing protein n=1 Tax=Microthyrium microscopicum TaxID=703497 RepID=A0A6A6TUV0_9PEZI|nr:DnaJ-domain-containing protein [Microthyrium microscopicum]